LNINYQILQPELPYGLSDYRSVVHLLIPNNPSFSDAYKKPIKGGKLRSIKLSQMEKTSIILTVIFSLMLLLFISLGWLRLSDIIFFVAGALITGIIGILVWGFKPRFDRQKEAEEERRKFNKDFGHGPSGLHDD